MAVMGPERVQIQFWHMLTTIKTFPSQRTTMIGAEKTKIRSEDAKLQTLWFRLHKTNNLILQSEPLILISTGQLWKPTQKVNDVF
jgi:hypothetical protein